MKVEQKEDGFKPVTITLESQEEVDKVFAVFNYSDITGCDPLYRRIYEGLKEHYSENYLPFWEKLRDILV